MADQPWSELQHIKNVIFGKEVSAIEYYPKESEKVDQANIYWLFIYPEGVIPNAYPTTIKSLKLL